MTAHARSFISAISQAEKTGQQRSLQDGGTQVVNDQKLDPVSNGESRCRTLWNFASEAAFACLLVLGSLFFPPLTVFMAGAISPDLLINLFLTLLGTSDFLGPRYIPGEAHALYTSFVYLDRRYRGPGDLARLSPAPGIFSRRLQQGGNFRVVYGGPRHDQKPQDGWKQQEKPVKAKTAGENSAFPVAISTAQYQESSTPPLPLTTSTETASASNCPVENVENEKRNE